jgi:hypothetical protein
MILLASIITGLCISAIVVLAVSACVIAGRDDRP